MVALEARGINVRFGGHAAVVDVDLDVESSCITGLIGPNGAGKTTTFNALCGLQTLHSGKVRMEEKDITSLATHQRAQLGLARTFQRLELFSSLTARENLQVAAEYRTPGGREPADVDEMLELVGITDIAGSVTGSLPTGQARLVELARALVIRPTVLLLDEPASGLDADETDSFIALLGELAKLGMAILIVEHDMPLVMSTCSKIYVLDFGRLIAVGSPHEIRHNEAVIQAYLGTDVE